MKLKVVVSLLAFVSLFAVAAQAQEGRQRVEVFAGYSYVRANPSTSTNGFSLNGGSASVSYNVNNWLSGVADFGGYTNTNIFGSGRDGTLSTYLFGPRVTYRRFRRVTPFGEVLFGVGYQSDKGGGISNSDLTFASAFGGGVDYTLLPAVALRAQAHSVHTSFFGGSQYNFRLSGGIVFRF